MKKLTYGLGISAATALLLTACGGPETPQTPTEQAGTILGKVQPMKQTTKTVTPVNSAVEEPGTAFTANVAATGDFDLHLPNANTVNNTYASDLNTVKNSYSYCDKNLEKNATFTTNAPEDMKILQINELHSNDGRQLFALYNDGSTFRQWWYSDRDFPLTFNGTDCFALGDVSANLALKRGWNVVEQSWTPVGDKNVTTYKIVNQPTKRTVYIDGTMAAQSINGFNINMLRPWQNPADLQ